MSVDGKIKSLNLAVRDMLDSLTDQTGERAEIQIAIITFGRQVKVHQAFAPVNEVQWQDMQADGSTPLGETLTLVTELLESREQIPSRAYRPTLVLVSDGQPKDAWEAALERLNNSERGKKAMRFAMGIGDDADMFMLQQFLNDPETHVFAAHEARQIQQFFRWVTMSVTQRLHSTNPDKIENLPQPSLDDYDY